MGMRHVKGFLQEDDCQIVGICDVDAHRRAEAAQEINITITEIAPIIMTFETSSGATTLIHSVSRCRTTGTQSSRSRVSKQVRIFMAKNHLLIRFPKADRLWRPSIGIKASGRREAGSARRRTFVLGANWCETSESESCKRSRSASVRASKAQAGRRYMASGPSRASLCRRIWTTRCGLGRPRGHRKLKNAATGTFGGFSTMQGSGHRLGHPPY
jgi:hypothetical protein